MLKWLVIILLLTACARTVPAQMATINGYDASTRIVVEPINLWRDYADRSKGITGQVHHGDRVTFIRQEGQGALVRTSAGVEGWLNIAFIRR